MLNERQMQIFEIVHKWGKKYVKNLNCSKTCVIQPIHIFLTGNGGCGKSHLVQTINNALNKLLSYNTNNLEKEKLLLLAPTGIAAINIGGSTIHFALKMPLHDFGKTVSRLSDSSRSTLTQLLSDISLIIIDEISMVSNVLLSYIHQRLVESFGFSSDLPFANKSVIAVGDFYQLPPINSKPVFFPFFDQLINLSQLWQCFKIGERTD